MGLDQKRPHADIPVMTFLSNFRELIRGQPEPGGKCRIFYDPSRIVPAKDYDAATDFQDPATRTVHFLGPATEYPVTAHLQFRPGGNVTGVPLSTRSGPLDTGLIRRDGRGTMLYGEFTIPADAEWIMAWFTHTDGYGKVLTDSRYGANYMFRFIEKDVDILGATVKRLPSQVGSAFRVDVAALPCVKSILVRYRAVNIDPGAQPVSAPFERATGGDGYGRQADKVNWTTGDIIVPREAVVAFDLIYFVGDRSYKEDNQGAFFIVHEGY